MRVYFHNLAIESHRSLKRVAQLVLALDAEGVVMTNRLDTSCDWAFCGAYEHFASFREAVNRENAYRRERGKPTIPVAHYNWDLYPWKLDDEIDGASWRAYVQELKVADLILVPSLSVVRRTEEYCGRESVVVYPACNAFEEETWDGGYVFQSMRTYERDPNAGVLERACEILGMRLVKPDGAMKDAEFRRALAGASVVVSPYREASTGGLAVLEALRLGKNVLVCNSSMNGAAEYLISGSERWGYRFAASHSPERLAAEIRSCHGMDYLNTPREIALQRAWVDANFSDASFSRKLAKALREGPR